MSPFLIPIHEAKRMNCPYGVYLSTQGESVVPKQIKCTGDECMAWKSFEHTFNGIEKGRCSIICNP